MHAARDGEDDQLQTTSSASPAILMPLHPAPAAAPSPASSIGTVSISAETYARLLSLADQAPLECLPLTSRTLARAKTLGYNHIGQIRSTPSSRLFADLGEDRAEELQRALFDFGMRPSQLSDLSD
jgi:hypothetical protein